MRRLFLILTVVFTIVGVAFTFLPLGTIALAPLFVAIIFGVLTYFKSNSIQRKTVNIILIIAFAAIICAVLKQFLAKDEVTIDTDFEKTKIESQKEAKKTLEEDLE